MLATGSSSSIGNEFISTNNEVLVSGPGSSWTSPVGFMLIGGGKNNRLLVTDGAQVVSYGGRMGNIFPDSSNNLAALTHTRVRPRQLRRVCTQSLSVVMGLVFFGQLGIRAFR